MRKINTLFKSTTLHQIYAYLMATTVLELNTSNMTTISSQLSSIDLGRFGKLREAVQGALDVLGQVAAELDAEKMRERLNGATRRLTEEKFRLVVVGEFSNGKSTLINALLGHRVLPSSTSPTTTALTIIEEGSKPKYSVQYHDGTVKELSLERFREIVAPREPDTTDIADVERYKAQVAVLAQVDLVNIQYPTQLCSQGVEIVDTPGTNDLDATRERITYEFLPKADAVIFVLSARQILSAQELGFLTGRVLKADIGRLFFAINFKDFLDTAEKRRKIIAYAKEHLGHVVDQPRIYLLCARDALTRRTGSKSMMPPMPLEETGIVELEQALVQFLESSRFAVKLEVPIRTGISVASDLLDGPLKIKRASIGLSIIDTNKKIAALLPELEHARTEHRSVLEGLQTRLAQEGEMIHLELKRGLEGIVAIGVAAVRGYEGELTREKIVEAVEKAIGKKHSEQIEQAKLKQRDALHEHCLRAERRMQVAWENVSIQVDAQFKGSISTDTLSLPTVASDDEVMGLSLGGGVGTIALVALAHIVFPVAIIAGIAAFFGFGSHIEARRRAKILDEVIPQIKERLSQGIQPTVDAFETEWKRSASEACSVFDTAFSSRIETLHNELQALAELHRSETRNAAEQHAWCDRIQANIEQAASILRECRWAH